MKIIIGGAGAVGTHLAKLLSRDHQDCVLIDDYIERLAALIQKFFPIIASGLTIIEPKWAIYKPSPICVWGGI